MEIKLRIINDFAFVSTIVNKSYTIYYVIILEFMYSNPQAIALLYIQYQ